MDLKFHGLPILRRPLATHTMQFMVFIFEDGPEIRENCFPRKKGPIWYCIYQVQYNINFGVIKNYRSLFVLTLQLESHV